MQNENGTFLINVKKVKPLAVKLVGHRCVQAHIHNQKIKALAHLQADWLLDIYSRAS